MDQNAEHSRSLNGTLLDMTHSDSAFHPEAGHAAPTAITRPIGTCQ